MNVVMSELNRIQFLSLLRWEELEESICGVPDVNLTTLKNFCKIRSSGLESDKTVEGYLWEVLNSFSNRERCLFVRFACGLSRLPGTFKKRKFFTCNID